MEQLNGLMQKLNGDTHSACSVYDEDENRYLHRNINQAAILENYGDAEDFFEDLFAKGHKNLTIQEKRSNGKNAFKLVGNAFSVKFGSKAKPEAEPKKKKKKKTKTGLGMGLGMAEIIDLRIQAHDRNELAKRCDKLENELEKMTSAHDALKEEKLQAKYTKEKSDSFNNMLLGAIEKAPMIMKGFGMNMGGAAGLGNYAEGSTQNLTEIQKALIDSVKSSDDDMNQVLLVIYNKINQSGDNNSFALDLQALLSQHNMIAV